MEDIKAYIESGVLELYVLRNLTDAERREVEDMCLKFPELNTELSQIENCLLQYSNVYSVEPPIASRDEFLSSMNFEVQAEPPQETAIVKLPSRDKSIRFYKFAFAASVTLLLISLFTIVNLNKELKESKNEIIALQSSNQKYASQVNYIGKELQDNKKFLQVYQNPEEYKLVTLKGTPKAPEASMKVAFNNGKQEVLIDVSSLNLPATDANHQYQLWALVDGKPIDLGVFDYTSGQPGLTQMKSIGKAQAFAVTLEKKGGSKTPTLTEMVVMGGV
ncbi:anti-sigma factor [Arcticibacter eurypsychrophilus]|uniref:anti-sigma factor n=1 Tax=Arcticibacter eurypsychrophilus TaxID=1434752 RepID=UPI00084CEA10|nr:anti-sigma factor [Arcticibacter eurypsychrophilus]